MTHHELRPSLRDVERNYILATVADCGGNRTHAAKKLKISLRSLRMKLNYYAAERDLSHRRELSINAQTTA